MSLYCWRNSSRTEFWYSRYAEAGRFGAFGSLTFFSLLGPRRRFLLSPSSSSSTGAACREQAGVSSR